MELTNREVCEFYRTLYLIDFNLSDNDVVFSFSFDRVSDRIIRLLLKRAKDSDNELPIDNIDGLKKAKQIKLFLPEFEELFSIPFFPNEKVFFKKLPSILKNNPSKDFSFFIKKIVWSGEENICYLADNSLDEKDLRFLKAYKKLRQVFRFLKRVSDNYSPEGVFHIYSSSRLAKISLKTRSDKIPNLLDNLIDESFNKALEYLLSDIENINLDSEEHLLRSLHIEFAKRAIVNVLRDELRNTKVILLENFIKRFREIAEEYTVIKKAFVESLESSKLKEDFEKKYYEIVEKLHSQLSDINSKAIFIPIALLFGVSKLSSSFFLNLSIFFGTLVFSTLICLYLKGQKKILSVVQAEIDFFKQKLEGLDDLKSKFESIEDLSKTIDKRIFLTHLINGLFLAFILLSVMYKSLPCVRSFIRESVLGILLLFN
jgi:hypothetical protein